MSRGTFLVRLVRVVRESLPNLLQYGDEESLEKNAKAKAKRIAKSSGEAQDWEDFLERGEDGPLFKMSFYRYVSKLIRRRSVLILCPCSVIIDEARKSSFPSRPRAPVHLEIVPACRIDPQSPDQDLSRRHAHRQLVPLGLDRNADHQFARRSVSALPFPPAQALVRLDQVPPARSVTREASEVPVTILIVAAAWRSLRIREQEARCRRSQGSGYPPQRESSNASRPERQRADFTL